MSGQIRQAREARAKVYRALRDIREGGHFFLSIDTTTELSSVHEVFHVFMLRKYTPDPAQEVDWGEINVDTDGTFEEGSVRIMDSRNQVLRPKTVRLVKML